MSRLCRFAATLALIAFSPAFLVGAGGTVRSGITVTDKSRDKSLWVGNDKRVRLALDVESAGVSLNLGRMARPLPGSK